MKNLQNTFALILFLIKNLNFYRSQSGSWKKFSEYSQESSIHSMLYIGKNDLHWMER